MFLTKSLRKADRRRACKDGSSFSVQVRKREQMVAWRLSFVNRLAHLVDCCVTAEKNKGIPNAGVNADASHPVQTKDKLLKIVEAEMKFGAVT